MDTVLSIVLIVVVIAFVVIYLRVAHSLDRDRIREHVERSGGKVIAIERNPFGKGWFGSGGERIYEVRYTTRHGKSIEATCKTSMFSGVYWTSDHPPESFGHDVSDVPAEPITCLSCGTRIPARDSRCPKCGWSYQAQ